MEYKTRCTGPLKNLEQMVLSPHQRRCGHFFSLSFTKVEIQINPHMKHNKYSAQLVMSRGHDQQVVCSNPSGGTNFLKLFLHDRAEPIRKERSKKKKAIVRAWR